MAFYEVIAGVLFLGAFRELLYAVERGEPGLIVMALTLAVIIANDVLWITEMIENYHVEYSALMKFLDLCGFVVVCCCFFLIEPCNQMLNVNLSTPLQRLTSATFGPEIWFWGLIAAHWALGILWNRAGDIFTYPGLKPDKKHFGEWPWFILILMLVNGVVWYLLPASDWRFATTALLLSSIVFYTGCAKAVALNEPTRSVCKFDATTLPPPTVCHYVPPPP